MSDKLSKQEHADILRDILADKLDGCVGVKKPRCFLLGGQPGAGKGGMRRAIEQSGAAKGCLVIDPDELRAYHPRYAEHVASDANTAAFKVHDDAIRWAGELRAAAIEKRVNLIIDGTLGNPSTATMPVMEAAAAGYQVEVHVVATSFEVSSQSVRGRFEKAFVECARHEDAELPRNVPRDVQQMAFNGISDSLRALAATGKVSRMRVADRNGDPLSDIASARAVKKDGAAAADKALQVERSRPWTKEELAEYTDNAETIRELMAARIDAIDDGTTAGAKAKETLIAEYEKLAVEMDAVIEAKGETMVSDEVALQARLENTGRTVKKDNWLFGFLGSLFSRKKKKAASGAQLGNVL